MLSGHNTPDALRILHDELKAHLDNFIHKRKRVYIFSFNAFDYRARHLAFNWISGGYLAVVALSLVTSQLFKSSRDNWVLAELVILILFLLINISFILYEEHLKLQEPVNKAIKFLSELADCSKSQKWQSENYINLNCPISQCISLQWTIRDSRVINLPCSLLVEGDVILLRPGQTVPAKCCSFKSYSKEREILERDGVFNPVHSFVGLDGSNSLSQCTPLQPEPYVLLETPFISAFELFLKNAVGKPAGVLDKERFCIYSVFCERKFIPAILVVMLIVNSLGFVLFKDKVGQLLDMVIVLQVQAIFPILAVLFPILWKLMDLFGSAKVLVLFESLKNGDFLQSKSSFFVFKKTMATFVGLMLGEADHLPRTSKIVQSLGNLTSFCCIDKKGILSWPNPSPEKLFFLTSTKSKALLRSPDSFVHQSVANLSQAANKKVDESISTCQVLNLTQDTKNLNSLFFDDFSWKNYITSLKPLGLGILLNTCNMRTTEEYTEFADHVKCMSLKQKEVVPVVNRRCFCELARQMGFTNRATEIFSTEDVFGIYQHDTSLVESKELIHREKYRMPMPNAFCVLVKDHSTDTKQLFSQGMADLLLSMCTDYWDGTEIRPLGNVERKKIADFYHRNSMTSYCTAFSYRPFNGDIPVKTSKSYLEVSENLFGSLKHLETSFLNGEFQRSSGKGCWSKGDSISSMSLQLGGAPDSSLGVPLKHLGNQIFIGMVTMQYQAKQDVVNLIEKLESSCIRFVHFSKENELRSRGFSEKMGLEAGWNCHISLLNEEEEEEEGGVAPCSEPLLKQKLYAPGCQKSFGSAPMLKAEAAIKPEKLESPEDVVSSLARCTASHHRNSRSLLVRKPSFNSNLQVTSKARKQKKKLSTEVEGFQALIGDKSDQTNSRSNSNSSLYSSYIEGLSEIQNRAQLPKGIENIRPHINNIDNVPLQVSLFTDCTISTTCEMLKILQEYGEVCCCLGSSLNMDNMAMFISADCSASKDPVFPQICNQESSCQDSHPGTLGPMQLSAKMQSLPCSLMFQQMDITSFHELISIARVHCQRTRTAARLFLLLQLCLSCLQFLNTVSFLPPCLSPQLVLWLSLVVVPTLSLSMMNNPSFSQVPPSVQGKNQRKIFNQWMSMEVVSFLVRYLPTIFVMLVVHAVNLYQLCCNNNSNSTLCDCHMFFGKSNTTFSRDWMNGDDVVLSQHFTCLQIVVYFAAISMCNVHRYEYLWKGSPVNNLVWAFVSLALIAVQVLWFFLFSSPTEKLTFEHISLAGWIISTIWIPVLFCLHEIAKKREIKVWIRQQKRAKLDFGTKLGMNSPF